MEKIGQGVWKVHCPGRTFPPYLGTECYFIVDQGQAIVIDTGDGGPHAQQALDWGWKTLGHPTVVAIYVTHHHLDHSGGAGWATKHFSSPTFIHPLEHSLLPKALQLNVRTIDALTITVGSRPIELLLAPGHCPGQVNIWIEEQAILLAGDNVLGDTSVLIAAPDGDMRDYQSTLKKLRDLCPAVIGPGHGSTIHDGVEYLNQYLRHRDERERQVIEALKAGPRVPTDIAHAVYGVASQGTVTERMIRSHLDALVSDGKARRDASGAYSLI